MAVAATRIKLINSRYVQEMKSMRLNYFSNFAITVAGYLFFSTLSVPSFFPSFYFFTTLFDPLTVSLYHSLSIFLSLSFLLLCVATLSLSLSIYLSLSFFFSLSLFLSLSQSKYHSLLSISPSLFVFSSILFPSLFLSLR